MIYCVWYPSGGFGHFVNAVLTLHGDGFARPKNDVKFSAVGDLHYLDLVLPKYLHNHNYNYNLETVDPNKNYSVLIDNGINDESTLFREKFKNSEVIKICYTDRSWPIVAKTSIIKALKTQLDSELLLEDNWESSNNWAVREKYFLYLKDHPNRHAWRPSPASHTLSVESLLDYKLFVESLLSFGINCTDFKSLHSEMSKNNYQHFSGFHSSVKIINAIKTNDHIDITDVTDLWDQAVVNYLLYLEFGVEVPANTYANWFTNTSEISKIL